MIKYVDNVEVEMTPEEEAEFIASRSGALPPGPYRLYKSVFIRRLTNEEAETMESVLAAADARLRLMFNSVEYFVSDDELFGSLVAAVSVALGAERAEELLAEEPAA